MTSARYSPAMAVMLALSLLGLGFFVGYGYHTAENAAPPAPAPTPQPNGGLLPPTVKGLRVSPDGRTVAFTGVYDNASHASRFLLDLKSGKYGATETPAGWQDYTMQWSDDGGKILFHRQKIPRKVEDTAAGLYEEKVRTGDSPGSLGAQSLTPRELLPADEKSISGFWAPGGKLVVKTSRDPKALYEVNAKPRLIDRAAGTFLQNRAVSENGRPVYYLVRDIGDKIKHYALFRTGEDGRARQLSEPLEGIDWSYVSEDARWMVVCRKREDGDWDWTLYKVTPQKATAVLTRPVPGDVISVFWSPDRKRILGASGKSLWSIDIPSLQVRQLGSRENWGADDAAWLGREQAVLVAADGILWKVAVPSGETTQVWKFPGKYWK